MVPDPAKPASDPEDELPPAPPPKLREPYLALSWSYLYWCAGMLVWSILCVSYFVLTRQTLEIFIALGLGVVMLAMLILPEVLFGGQTWYKRLAWITILAGLFSALFLYPMVMVVIGIVTRATLGRYTTWPWDLNHWWHLALSILTLLLQAWALVILVRAGKLVRRLSRGDWR